MTARDLIESIGQMRALEGGGAIVATQVEVHQSNVMHVKATITFDCWLPREVAGDLERPCIANFAPALPPGAPRLGNG